MQSNESLVINDEGLIPYNIPIYRVTKNDMLTLNIVTTPKRRCSTVLFSSPNSQAGTGSTGVGVGLEEQ